MSTSIPEDVHAVIARQVMAFPKGAHGEERESLRKLRDLTLLNLSLTSKEISSVSLLVLYRNVTVTPFNSRLLLPHTRDIHNPFIHTRSLTLGTSTLAEEMTDEMQNEYMRNQEEAYHPDLDLLHEELLKLHREAARLSGTIPESKQKQMGVLVLAKAASIASLIIETMPNLQLLETGEWVSLYFVRLHVCPKTGARFSRPLSGLSNLKILKMGPSLLEEISGTKCVWLMLFLPKLTHLKAYVEFRFSDERFFQEHLEDFVGKSNVTHLELSFRIMQDSRNLWPRSTNLETDLLEKLFSVTEGLVELKLRNTAIPLYQSTRPSSLLFLRSLKSSFNSLKYLSSIGDLTEKRTGSEAEDRKREPPVSINLKSLEMISFDCLSTRALSRTEESSRIRLSFPSLKFFYFLAGPDLQESPFPPPSHEVAYMNWIKSKFFPTSVKKVILDEKLLDVNGRVVDVGEDIVKWQKDRAELLAVCREKKLEVKILKVGEQLPFGVMPEPEDLF